MSKIMRVLKQAETERLGYVESFKQELRSELQWVGSVMSRWSPAGASTPQPGPGVPGAASESPTTPGPRNGGDAAAPVAASPSWEQALALVRQQLQRCEQQAAAEAGSQVRLKAQIAELEQQARRMEQERLLAGQRLAHAAQTAETLEALRQRLSQQLEAARVCQGLARDLSAAVERFEANGSAITRLAQDSPSSADPIAHYQQLADALQQHVVQFSARLARAVAALGNASAPTQQPMPHP